MNAAPKLTTEEIADLDRLDCAAVTQWVQNRMALGANQQTATAELAAREGCTFRVASVSVFDAVHGPHWSSK